MRGFVPCVTVGVSGIFRLDLSRPLVFQDIANRQNDTIQSRAGHDARRLLGEVNWRMSSFSKPTD